MLGHLVFSHHDGEDETYVPSNVLNWMRRFLSALFRR